MSTFPFPVFVFDVEVFPNFFMLGVQDYVTREIRQWSNVPGVGGTLAEARAWYREHRDTTMFVGFNSAGYDNVMARAVLIHGVEDPAELFDLSVQTIAAKRVRVERIDTELAVDLLLVHGGMAARIGSLKECGCKCDYPYLQELPYAFDTHLNTDQMREVMAYNCHDLNVTCLTLQKSEQMLLARIALAFEYNQFDLLNQHDAKVAVSVLEKQIFGGRKPDYPRVRNWHVSAKKYTDGFSYQTPALEDLRQRVSSWELYFALVTKVKPDGDVEKTIDSTRLSDGVSVDGVNYSFGVGGLHSQDEPGIWEADEHYRIIDFDCGSFYPGLVEINELHPAHVDKAAFLRVYSGLRTRRMTAKANGEKVLADGLKISINSVFGKTKSPYAWCCDPVMNVAITILGQLNILCFVDTVAGIDGIDVVTVNTDGFMLRIRRDIADQVLDAMQIMAARLKLELDVKEYVRIARRDVSNYVAVALDGSIKGRGAYGYDTSDLKKKNTQRIVTDAVQRFFCDGTPVADTIRACQDITAFTDFFKCQKGYSIGDTNGVDYGGVARWYIAADGVRLDKVRAADGNRSQLVAAGARVLNELPASLPGDVDFAAYEAIALKRVTEITEPDARETHTIPFAELSNWQAVQQYHNQSTLDANPATIAGVDLTRAMRDYASVHRGNRYDSMKAIAVSLWLAGCGTLTRGDLLHLLQRVDEGTGYFAGNKARSLDSFCAWIAEKISPWPIPQTIEDHVTRAMTWAAEKVQPLTRMKRKLEHRGVLNSDFLSGDTIRKYDRTRNEYALACAICAVGVKHQKLPGKDVIISIISDVQSYFSAKEI